MLRWLLGCTLGAELLLLRRFGERRELCSSSPELSTVEVVVRDQGTTANGQAIGFHLLSKSSFIWPGSRGSPFLCNNGALNDDDDD